MYILICLDDIAESVSAVVDVVVRSREGFGDKGERRFAVEHLPELRLEVSRDTGVTYNS